MMKSYLDSRRVNTVTLNSQCGKLSNMDSSSAVSRLSRPLVALILVLMLNTYPSAGTAGGVGPDYAPPSMIDALNTNALDNLNSIKANQANDLSSENAALRQRIEAMRRAKLGLPPDPDVASSSQGASGGGDQACIADFQRALLALKKMYLQNARNAITLNDAELGNYEVPLLPCPAPARRAEMTQRETMDAAASLAACGVQALKCAIEKVNTGGECKASVDSCQAKYVAR